VLRSDLLKINYLGVGTLEGWAESIFKVRARLRQHVGGVVLEWGGLEKIKAR
jgi:hypothetical protein